MEETKNICLMVKGNFSNSNGDKVSPHTYNDLLNICDELSNAYKLFKNILF